MLKLRFKNNTQNAVWLVEPKVSIGSAANNDLVISGGEIAEHHADILVKHENLTLVNVSGSKLLSVNGKPVEKSARLKLNDEVKLGDTTLEIVDPKADISAAPAAQGVTESQDNQSTGWALKPNHSALANRIFALKKETVIGRSNECDITLAAAHLSRRHVKLTVQDGVLFVKDLGSANGTYLNGKRITEARVKRGDELRFDTLSFGVIGPVEDLDKTTIRKVDNAMLAAAESMAKKPGGPARKAASQPVRAGASARSAMAADDDLRNVGAEVTAPAKGKGLWIVTFLLVLAIGAVVAYRQGIFDPWFK